MHIQVAGRLHRFNVSDSRNAINLNFIFVFCEFIAVVYANDKFSFYICPRLIRLPYLYFLNISRHLHEYL